MSAPYRRGYRDGLNGLPWCFGTGGVGARLYDRGYRQGERERRHG